MTLLEKIQHIVCEYGAESLAQELGKPYKTLMRELNPNDEGAKLGLMTFFQILRISRDFSPLNEIAKMFGRVIIEIPERITTNDLTKNVSAIIKEMGNLLKEIGEVTSPDSKGGVDIVEDEQLLISEKGYGLLQALACLLTYLEK